MPWVITFVISWALFFALVDFRRLKTNIIGGVLSLGLGTLVDWGGQHLGLYEFHDLIIPWAGCSAFYKFGPIFTMGVIFVQHVPKGKWLQALNVLVVSLLYLGQEYLIIQTHAANYLHWHLLASFLVDLLTFSTLSWVTTAFLRMEELASFH